MYRRYSKFGITLRRALKALIWLCLFLLCVFAAVYDRTGYFNMNTIPTLVTFVTSAWLYNKIFE